MEQVFILILSRSTLYTRGAGAAVFPKLFSPARSAGFIYPPRDFSTSVSRAYSPYSLYFIRSMKLYPPPLFCQPFSFVFPRFFIFCRFCGCFSVIFVFPNKKLSTAVYSWITRFFILQAIPLAVFVYKKSAATAVTARKTQIPIVAKQPLCKRLVQRKHKKNLHFYRKHRFSRTKKDGKSFAIDFS